MHACSCTLLEKLSFIREVDSEVDSYYIDWEIWFILYTNAAWTRNCRQFRGHAYSHLYIKGGGSPEKKIFFAQITAIAFSYIRTEFGASRSMRVGVRSAKQ